MKNANLLRKLLVLSTLIPFALAICATNLNRPALAQGDTWETKAPMPTATNTAASGVINGKLLVVGGGANGHVIAALQEYDPTTDTWSERPPLPTPRPGAVSGVVGDKLYVVGGCIQNDCSGATTGLLEAYDSVSHTWSTLSPMPTPRLTAAAGVIDGKLYVAGGTSHTFSSLAALEVYDPTADSWTTKAPMPIAGTYYHGAVITGRLYLVGGSEPDSNTPPTGRLLVYDPVTDTWETKASMPTPTMNCAVGVINGQSMLLGECRTWIIRHIRFMIRSQIPGRLRHRFQQDGIARAQV